MLLIVWIKYFFVAAKFALFNGVNFLFISIVVFFVINRKH